MLTVHHLGISQSERIVWLCEELELSYQLVLYDRDPVTRLAPAAYKALHPLGTAPIITDGDMALAETNAIVEYILAKHGRGRLSIASDDPDFAHYLFWLHYANGSVQPAGLTRIMFSAAGITEATGPLKTMLARLDQAYALIEKRLGKADYFAGSRFTAADIMMVYLLTRSRAHIPRDLASFPNTRAYLKRIGDRPAYKRMVAKGDPNSPPKLD